MQTEGKMLKRSNTGGESTLQWSLLIVLILCAGGLLGAGMASAAIPSDASNNNSDVLIHANGSLYLPSGEVSTERIGDKAASVYTQGAGWCVEPPMNVA